MGIKLVKLMCSCRLCNDLLDSDVLVWCKLDVKEICITTRIQYGTKIQVCKKCQLKYNLKEYIFPEKVSITILRNTRDIIRILKEKWKFPSYDGVFYHLIEKSGYEGMYEEVNYKKRPKDDEQQKINDNKDDDLTVDDLLNGIHDKIIMAYGKNALDFVNELKKWVEVELEKRNNKKVDDKN